MLWLLPLIAPATAKTLVVCAPSWLDASICDAYTIEEAFRNGATEALLTSGIHDTDGVRIDRYGAILRAYKGDAPPILSTANLSVDSVLQITADLALVEAVIIDPSALRPAQPPRGLHVTGGAYNVVLSGVDVVNGGHPDEGGGLFVDQGAYVEVFGGAFIANTSPFGVGGHVAIDGAEALFYSTSFDLGRAYEGGALHLSSGSHAQLELCTLRNNWATDLGGHVAVTTGAQVAIDQSSLQGGRADFKGAGIHAGDGTEVRLTYNIFSDGGAATAGDDVYAIDALTVWVVGSTFVGNPTVGQRTSTVLTRVDDAWIYGNEYIRAGGTNGGAISAIGVHALDVSFSWFCDSAADRGAGLHLTGGCTKGCTINNNVFARGNAANDGAGLHASEAQGTLDITRNTFLDNAAGLGGAAIDLDATDAWVTKNLVLGNRAFEGAAVVLRNPSVFFSTNGFWGNVPFDLSDGSEYGIPVDGDNHVLFESPVLVDTAPFVPQSSCGPAVVAPLNPANRWLVDNKVGAWSGDADEDGAPKSFDCDDYDATVSPLAVEVPGDGIDQDCDGLEVCFIDADGDGAGGEQLSMPSPDFDCVGGRRSPLGGDCDDDNDRVGPTIAEVPYDGIDQDCTGADLTDVDGDGVPFPADCDDDDGRVRRCDVIVGGGGCHTAPGGPTWAPWLLALVVVGYRGRR